MAENDASLFGERGKFIVIEGLDGVGKAIHTRLLADFLRKKGIPAVETEEPRYGNRIGDMLKDFQKGEFEFKSKYSVALAYIIDRYEHAEEIKEWLRSSWVVSSRYMYTTLAYQGGIMGIDDGWLVEVQKFLPKPDLVIYINIDPLEAVARRGELERFEKLEFQKKADEEYEKLSKEYGFEVVNGMRTALEIANDIQKIVEKRLLNGQNL